MSVPAHVAYPRTWEKVLKEYAEVRYFGGADGLCTFYVNDGVRCYDCGRRGPTLSVQVGYRLGGDFTPFHGPEYAYLCPACAAEREQG